MAKRTASSLIEIFPEHGFWKRDLFPEVGSGLEETVDRAVKILAEAVPGTHAVLIGSEAFAQVAGLEELLGRVPPELGRSLAVIADAETAEQFQRRKAPIPVFVGPMEVVIHLGSMAGLESVTYLGPGREGPLVLQYAQALRLPFRPPVSLSSNVAARKFLLLLGRTLRVPEPILRHLDPAGLEEPLRQAA